jgi:hypothetical protein
MTLWNLAGRRILVGTLLALALLVPSMLLLNGCGSSQQLRDLEKVPARDPDLVELYNNVNDHPNLVMVCIHGVAFVTTTRDYKPFEREPDLDRNCPSAVTK